MKSRSLQFSGYERMYLLGYYNLIFDALICVFLFLAFSQFSGHTNRYLLMIAIVIILKKIILNETVTITKNFILFCIFCLSYILVFTYNFGYSRTIAFQWVAGMPLIYLLSDEIRFYGNGQQKFKYLFIMMFGLFMHGFLNLVSFNPSIGRNPIDIWSGNIMAATLQNTLFTLAAAIFSVYLFFSKNKILKVCSAIILTICIVNGFLTSTRTGLFIIAILLLINLIIKIIRTKNKKSFKKLVTILISIFGVCCLLLLILMLCNVSLGSVLPLIDRYIKNPGYMFKIDPRFEIWLTSFVNIFKFPFGGFAFKDAVGAYAHNLWLDIFINAGWLAGILYLVITGLNIATLVKVFKSKKIGSFDKLLILSIMVALYINSAVEAILDGNILVLYVLTYMQAFAKKLVNENKTKGDTYESFMAVQYLCSQPRK